MFILMSNFGPSLYAGDVGQATSPPAGNTAPGYVLPPVSTLTKGQIPGDMTGQFPPASYAQAPYPDQWIPYAPQGFIGRPTVFLPANWWESKVVQFLF